MFKNRTFRPMIAMSFTLLIACEQQSTNFESDASQTMNSKTVSAYPEWFENIFRFEAQNHSSHPDFAIAQACKQKIASSVLRAKRGLPRNVEAQKVILNSWRLCIDKAKF